MEQQSNLTQVGAGATLGVDTTFYGWVSQPDDLTAATELYVCGVSIPDLLKNIDSVEALALDILGQVKECTGLVLDNLDPDDMTSSRPHKFGATPTEMAEALWEDFNPDGRWIIDFGNSTEGQIGAVVRVPAKTPAHALRVAKEWFSYSVVVDEGDCTFCTYVNWDVLTIDDVREDD